MRPGVCTLLGHLCLIGRIAAGLSPGADRAGLSCRRDRADDPWVLHLG